VSPNESYENSRSDFRTRQQSRQIVCDARADEVAQHRNSVRPILAENSRLLGRQQVGGPAHTSHRTCTCDVTQLLRRADTVSKNIRVVAAYYTRITIPRLIALLDLTAQQTEEVLARLVVSGTVWARIDRPAGIVNFRNRRSAEDVMNDWSSDMQKLLGLVEKTWMGVNAAQAAQSRAKP
jgi:26S proteasome regulatory subunit N5